MNPIAIAALVLFLSILSFMSAFISSVISNVEVKLFFSFCAVEGEEEERLDIG